MARPYFLKIRHDARHLIPQEMACPCMAQLYVVYVQYWSDGSEWGNLHTTLFISSTWVGNSNHCYDHCSFYRDFLSLFEILDSGYEYRRSASGVLRFTEGMLVFIFGAGPRLRSPT